MVAKTTAQQRAAAVERINLGRSTVATEASRFRVNPRTVRYWLNPDRASEPTPASPGRDAAGLPSPGRDDQEAAGVGPDARSRLAEARFSAGLEGKPAEGASEGGGAEASEVAPSEATAEGVVASCEDVMLGVTLAACGTKRVPMSAELDAASKFTYEERSKLLLWAPHAAPHVSAAVEKVPKLGLGLFLLALATVGYQRWRNVAAIAAARRAAAGGRRPTDHQQERLTNAEFAAAAAEHGTGTAAAD